MRRCKCGCRQEIKPARQCTSYMEKLGFATEECQGKVAIEALSKVRSDNKKKKVKEDKEYRKETKRRREKLKKRTGKGGHYDDLKTAKHYYIKHVLRKGEPCYTCGLEQTFTDSPQAFHVGHFMAAKSVDPRRFMLFNLRMQCQCCNTHNSGMRAEYRINMIEEMGIGHTEWLECEVNHKSLKEQYPEISDIKKETAFYRKINRQVKKLELI